MMGTNRRLLGLRSDLKALTRRVKDLELRESWLRDRDNGHDDRLDRHQDGLTQHNDRLLVIENHLVALALADEPDPDPVTPPERLVAEKLRAFSDVSAGQRVGMTSHRLRQATSMIVRCACGWDGSEDQVWHHLRQQMERNEGPLSVVITP